MRRSKHAKLAAVLEDETASQTEREFARRWLAEHPLRPLTREEILATDDRDYGESEGTRQLRREDVEGFFGG